MKKSESLPSALALRAAQLIERLGKALRTADHAAGLVPAQWEALRYLARANRFSRTPAALAEYAGATRGTISQTLIALEAKGYVRKIESQRDRRSVDLQLTAAARALIASDDPMTELAQNIDAAGGVAALTDALEETLRATLVRREQRRFGQCGTCRHFRADVQAGKSPHHCALIDEPLSAAESELICIEQMD